MGTHEHVCIYTVYCISKDMYILYMYLYQCVCLSVFVLLTSTRQVAGQTLVGHEHLARGSGVRDGVLGSHISTHNPESVNTSKLEHPADSL